MFIFVIIFLILMLYGSKFIRQGYIEEPLNYNNTIALRGLCAIEIVIGHIGVATESPWLFVNRKAGILIVGLFFLLSGYGLMYSKNTKENYMENFLRCRIPKILLPVLPIYVIYFIIEIIGTDKSAVLNVILQYMFLWKVPEQINWYVTECLGLYFIFYILYRKLNIKAANIVLSLVCVSAVVIMWVIGMDNPWYGNTLCFPLGVLLAQYNTMIYSEIKKRYILILFGSFVSMCIGIFMFFVLDDYSFIANVMGRSIASVSFCIMAVTVLLKVKLGNKVTSYIGTMSYELFLVHELFVFQKIVDMNIFYCICAFLLSVLFAFLLHKCSMNSVMKRKKLETKR